MFWNFLSRSSLLLAVFGLGASLACAQTAPLGPSPSAAPAAAPMEMPMAAAGNYILSANDVIQIRVFQEDDLASVVRVSKDGTVTLPLIGTTQIGGKTVSDAAKLIQDQLQKDYLVNPQVTVGIVEYAKRRFAVLGQVAKPGFYLIPNEESVTVLQAIAMAGGYTRIADPSRITIKRKSSSGDQVIKLNAKAMAKDDRASQFDVRPDDTITVGESIF